MNRFLYTIVVTLMCLFASRHILADQITLKDAELDAQVRMAWITALSESPQGNNAACRLGQSTASDSSLIMFTMEIDTVTSHNGLGLDSSNIDSIIVKIFNTTSTSLSETFGTGDSVWCALYKVVPDDTNWTEAQVTHEFQDKAASKAWDTLSLGHGNDIVIESDKAEIFGDGSEFDTMFVFIGAQGIDPAEDYLKNQREKIWDNLQTAGADFEFYLPIQDFKEAVASGDLANYVIKPFRIFIEGGDNVASIQFHGDDGIGANQMEIYIFYTESGSETPTPTRRRRIIGQLGRQDRTLPGYTERFAL